MSHPVHLKKLAERLDEYGAAAFVVTVGDGGVPKVVHVPVAWDGQVLRCTPGGGTLRNLGSPAPVTLVFPGPAEDGFSMLVDGSGTAAGEVAVITPTSAVLHRPAPEQPGDDAAC